MHSPGALVNREMPADPGRPTRGRRGVHAIADSQRHLNFGKKVRELTAGKA